MAHESEPASIGDFFELQRGTTYKSKLKGQPGPVLLGLGSIQRNGGFRHDKLTTYGGDSPEKLLVRPGELFVSLKDVTQAADLLGSVAMVSPQVSVGRLTQDTVKLIPKSDDVPLSYLYWVLRAPQTRALCRSRATGTTNLGLARGDFLSIPVPPLTEERQLLISLIEGLDDKIELNRQMNQTLEALAQALFQSWFIDFDGVPPEELVESELGLIPRGWEVAELQDLIGLDKGLSYKSKNFDPDGIPMVNLKCIARGGGFQHSGIKCYSGEYKPKHVVHPGDIVVAMTDLTQDRVVLASPALIPRLPGASEIIISLDLSCPRIPSESRLTKPWLYYRLNTREFKEFARGFANGTTVMHLKLDGIKRYRFALPPSERIESFSEIASDVRKRIDCNTIGNDSLTDLRDTLLPKLISGEIRVPEAETQVEAVL